MALIWDVMSMKAINKVKQLQLSVETVSVMATSNNVIVIWTSFVSAAVRPFCAVLYIGVNQCVDVLFCLC